jgi:membrane protein implicated in regulation of membrane protease activity
MELLPYLNSEFFWMIFGIIAITLEIFIVSGIGFLFVGLGALTSFAALNFNILEADIVTNLAVFLTSVVAWWALLWYPMKLSKRSGESYQGLNGSVITLSSEIRKGKTGSIIWSGVKMRATLDKEEPASLLKEGTKARITKIKGNMLYLIKES